MNESAPGGRTSAPARSGPLLVTAELPADVLAWADAIRRRHFPPDRNRLKAHVTLFHGLPPSAHDEVRRLLGGRAAVTPPPVARVAGLLDLGGGTAFAVESGALCALHTELADRLTGVIQQRDDRPFRPHITVQNKVGRAEATALQAELSRTPFERSFRFAGFGLYRWDGEIWRFERLIAFRGQRSAPAAR